MSSKNSKLVILNIIFLLILISITLYGFYRNLSNLKNNESTSIMIDLSENPYKERLAQSEEEAVDFKEASILMLIGPVGTNVNIIQSVLELPKEVIIGLSPYSSNIGEVINQIISHKHEAVIHIPMQPTDYPQNDPGPYALLNSNSDHDNISKLNSLINNHNSISGIYSEEKEIYTNNQNNVQLLLEIIKKANLHYIYGNGRENLVLKNLNEKSNYPVIYADLWIDNEIDSTKIKNKLNELEKIAVSNKIAVGMARAYPKTIELIQEWSKKLEEKKIRLITLKELIERGMINK